jgi:hypothetical protein
LKPWHSGTKSMKWHRISHVVFILQPSSPVNHEHEKS